jgi:hypothetical protein
VVDVKYALIFPAVVFVIVNVPAGIVNETPNVPEFTVLVRVMVDVPAPETVPLLTPVTLLNTLLGAAVVVVVVVVVVVGVGVVVVVIVAADTLTLAKY